MSDDKSSTNAQAVAKAVRDTYPTVALVLQGGGALGACQAGVYQALAEADLRPSWIAGISIGALNAAIIAGNPIGHRVERLREFWETICRPPFFPTRRHSTTAHGRCRSRTGSVAWRRGAR